MATKTKKRSRVRISPKTKKAQGLADAISTAASDTAKKASAKEMAAETVAKTKAPKPEKAKRSHHEGVNLTYEGSSKIFNKVSSQDAKTPIRVRVSKKYGDRVVSVAADMAKQYGGKPWSRLNVGAGALGRALFFGTVAYVGGADNVTEDEDGPIYHGRNAKFKVVNPKNPHAPANTKLASLR